MTPKITAQELRAKWNYDPSTGLFTAKTGGHGLRAGDAIGCPHASGYLVTKTNGRQYSLHRLAWLYMHGEWPPGDLDHRDKDKTNNRIGNLRPCNDSQNQANRGLMATNKSGRSGVCWVERSKKWQAGIKVDGKSRHLGWFDDLEDAARAYAAAKIEAHGEFAPAHSAQGC